MRRHTFVAVGLPVAVTAICFVAGCGAQRTVHDAAPAPLRLVDAGTTVAALGRPEPAPGAGGGGSPYVVRTALPTGTPAPAAVWRLPRATGSDAARVAASIGVTTPLTAVDGGWLVRTGARLLTVRADGSWSLGVDCLPDAPIEQENVQVGCATASTATPAQPLGPTSARARDLAAPVLATLGWSDSLIDVEQRRPTTSVSAQRSVDGLDTADWTTTLTFTATDTLDAATGWATTPTRGRSYPLITAAQAFRALANQPRPMIAEPCRIRTDGKPGCEPPSPVVITGARLGLALRHEPDRALLVPAWLFDVAGSAQPLAVVAVAPQYLATPSPVPMGAPASTG